MQPALSMATATPNMVNDDEEKQCKAHKGGKMMRHHISTLGLDPRPRINQQVYYFSVVEPQIYGEHIIRARMHKSAKNV